MECSSKTIWLFYAIKHKDNHNAIKHKENHIQNSLINFLCGLASYNAEGKKCDCDSIGVGLGGIQYLGGEMQFLCGEISWNHEYFQSVEGSLIDCNGKKDDCSHWVFGHFSHCSHLLCVL